VTSDAFLAQLEALPALDVLVNNAGMNVPLPIEEVDVATLDAMLALNVRAVYRTSQAAVRAMLRAGRGGSIIHMSSQMGHVGAPRRTVYCMTKHAVEGLTKAMAVELASRGIRVNAVAPTFIETELTRLMFSDVSFRREVLDAIPLGRIGTPEDIVGAVLFLASAASALVTGASLKVDGGWTAR
jgi:NAD(P)-dependent dehydrogenase (short-subunit alcohol dehydrogenase family)